MATEEIQISQLELAQEVQGDMVFAVDTATDTKSLSVNQLKNHISQPLQANINAVDTSALHKYNISNCITEIPQDIKLELNNGRLTLKAGSKVYYPNGFESDGTTPHFDTITITSDLTHTGDASNNNERELFVVIDRTNLTVNRLGLGRVSTSVSGTTPPTSGYFYNTSDNTLKFYSSSTAQHDDSFPICICSTSSTSQGAGYYTSIDQVFNGFGYIGSTVFVLPGVKGLIPNGRNADGTLKNTELTLNKVKTRNFSGTINEDIYLVVDNTGIKYLTKSSLSYNEQDNFLYKSDNTIQISIIGGYFTVTNDKISSLTPKTAFHAVDYNDFEKAMLKEDWVKVSTPPASPDSSKFYYIPED